MNLKKISGVLIISILATYSLYAQTSDWSYHFQITVINQKHAGFKTAYSGSNSLADSVEPGATSVTATVFLGRRLWKGASLYFNPELSGGKGLSYALGVAGALNGETYRIGDPEPVVSVARVIFRQVIPLGSKLVDQEDDLNQLAGKVPARRIEINAGKFSMNDFFDQNSYSQDPRTQFLNWSLMSNGAWDYPANTKGYTMGIVVGMITPKWELRISSVAVPKIANHPNMEYKFGKAHSETIEVARNFTSSKLSLLVSYMANRAPSYKDAMTFDTTLLNVIEGNATGQKFGGHKSGICLNYEQRITDDLGGFARAGWNDGKYATWAFTEIDQTLQAGLSLKGNKWKRPGDVLGLAGVVNGISTAHRNFLKAGGHGFILGDGGLNYGHEAIIECYYSALLFKSLWLSGDYQFVHNPGYNKDRKGPVHVFAVRAHVAF